MGNKTYKVTITEIYPLELNENEIQLIAHNTGFSREKIIQWHKKFIDDYPSGYIDKHEFIQSFRSLYSFGSAERFAQFAFKLFDKDSNNKLSFREFLISTAFISYNNLPGHRKKSLEIAFEMFDLDDNQKIEKNEIIKFFDAINSQLSTSEHHSKLDVAKFFKKYDLDNSHSLDKNEFINAINEEKILDIFMN